MDFFTAAIVLINEVCAVAILFNFILLYFVWSNFFLAEK